MPLVLANRVQEAATANTTVSFTLTGAIAGFQTFAVIGDTNTTYYSAVDGVGNWEVGLGTYSTTGPTLTRTTIYASSNSNLAVTFSGVVSVFVTYPSGRSVNLDASGNVSALGTISSGTWQGSTIGVAYGGTGVTASSGANSVMLRDANQNVAVNRLNQSNTDTSAAGGTTALTAASSYSQTLTGTGNQTYTMPDATTLTTGVAFVFNNNATGTLTLQDYATGAIGTITSGGAAELVLLNNGTTAGTWDVHGFLPENVTWGTNALNLGSTVISNGTWQGGTIQPAYGGTGLTTFVGANNALYSTGATTLTAGTLPVAAGGTGITTGTSGGVPYFSAAGTIASSGALVASALVIGGGAGNAPSTTTTGTGVLTALGVNVGTAGSFVVNGGALGTPASGTVTNLTGTASININGTVGATTPNTGSFTSLTDSGNLAFTGTGNRITGDFTNATVANRVMFQTSTANSPTSVSTIPSGTNTQSDFFAFNAADPNNASLLLMRATTAETTIRSGITGTGTYLPMTFYTGGSERMRVDTSGRVGINRVPVSYNLEVSGSTVTMAASASGTVEIGAVASDFFSAPSYSGTILRYQGTAVTGTTAGISNANLASVVLQNCSNGLIYTNGSAPLIFGTVSAERMRIDSSGNVGIGTGSPARRLDVRGGFGLQVNEDGAGTKVISLRSDFAGVGPAVNVTTNDPLLFLTNNTERARISSTGTATFNGDVVFSKALQENVFTITDSGSVDIDPSNGTIQLWTLGANRTPTASNFAAGESVTLMILDGTAFTITWSSIGVTWVGSSAPSLHQTLYTVIELWKVGSVVYGALVGYA